MTERSLNGDSFRKAFRDDFGPVLRGQNPKFLLFFAIFFGVRLRPQFGSKKPKNQADRTRPHVRGYLVIGLLGEDLGEG